MSFYNLEILNSQKFYSYVRVFHAYTLLSLMIQIVLRVST